MTLGPRVLFVLLALTACETPPTESPTPRDVAPRDSQTNVAGATEERAQPRQQFGETELELLERALRDHILPAPGEITPEGLLSNFDWSTGGEVKAPEVIVEATPTIDGDSRRRLMSVVVRGTAESDHTRLKVFFPESVKSYRLFGYQDQSYRHRGYETSEGGFRGPINPHGPRTTTPTYGEDSNLSSVSISVEQPTTALLYQIELSEIDHPTLAQFELVAGRRDDDELTRRTGEVPISDIRPIDASSDLHRQVLAVSMFAEIVGASDPRANDIDLGDYGELVEEGQHISPELASFMELYDSVSTQLSESGPR